MIKIEEYGYWENFNFNIMIWLTKRTEIPVLQHVYSDGKNLVASDGRMLIIFTIPDKYKFEKGIYNITKEKYVFKFYRDYREEGILKYPDYERIIPSQKAAHKTINLIFDRNKDLKVLDYGIMAGKNDLAVIHPDYLKQIPPEKYEIYSYGKEDVSVLKPVLNDTVKFIIASLTGRKYK